MNDAINRFVSGKSELCKEWMDAIEEMLSSDNYRYATNTLEDIYEHIEKYNSVSERQIQAIKNIRSKPSYERY